MVVSIASSVRNAGPQVSIVLPTYNGAAWLLRAVESVRGQHGVDWELVVVDDGSGEDPGPTLASYGDDRIRYFRQRHAGKGAALNAGIRLSRAALICFIDQDDVMLPGRLERQMDAFRRWPSAEVVYSDYERRDDNGRFIDRFISRDVSTEEALHQMALGRSPISMQTVMLRKRVWEAVGGFSERTELMGLDDLEFFVRLLLAKPVMAYAPGVVQSWVRHGSNFSGSGAFQETRLHLLQRLSELAAQHPVLRREIRHFAFHGHSMRGIHFLEKGRPYQAAGEFLKAVTNRPTDLNAYYLLFKSLFLGALTGRPKTAQPTS